MVPKDCSIRFPPLHISKWPAFAQGKGEPNSFDFSRVARDCGLGPEPRDIIFALGGGGDAFKRQCPTWGFQRVPFCAGMLTRFLLIFCPWSFLISHTAVAFYIIVVLEPALLVAQLWGLQYFGGELGVCRGGCTHPPTTWEGVWGSFYYWGLFPMATAN